MVQNKYHVDNGSSWMNGRLNHNIWRIEGALKLVFLNNTDEIFMRNKKIETC